MDGWKPNRKIVAASIAGIVAWAAQEFAGVQVPPGIEAALAVVVAYLVPGTASQPIDAD